MRGKLSREIQREGFMNNDDFAVTLEKLFENEGGIAFVHVTYLDKDGQRYGSAKTIQRQCLEGREYTLAQSSLHPWIIHMSFTDEVYEIGKKMLPLFKYLYHKE